VKRERRARLWSARRFAGVVASAGLHGLVVGGLCLQPNPKSGPEGPIVVVQLIGPLPNAEAQAAEAGVPRPQAGPAARPAAPEESGGPAAAVATASASSGANAVSTAASAAVATGLEGRDELHYQDELLAYITRFRAYPDAARPSRLVGRVLIRFAMSRDGKVLDVWIDHSSGEPILDDAARDTVLRAQPLPPIPASLPSVLTLSLPVDFSPPGPV
jgi:protein TonB